jgi:hypothetical protein
MQIIYARTPFWVFVSGHADKPYQDIFFDSDHDLLIVAGVDQTGTPNRHAIALDWASQERRVEDRSVRIPPARCVKRGDLRDVVRGRFAQTHNFPGHVNAAA